MTKYRHTPVAPNEIVIGAPINKNAVWQDPNAIRIARATNSDHEFHDIIVSLLENVGVWRLIVAYENKKMASRLVHRIANGSTIWAPKGLFASSIRTVASGQNTYYYVYAKAVEPE